MPHDRSNDRASRGSIRAAAYHVGTAGISRPAVVPGRQPIQLIRINTPGGEVETDRLQVEELQQAVNTLKASPYLQWNDQYRLAAAELKRRNGDAPVEEQDTDEVTNLRTVEEIAQQISLLRRPAQAGYTTMLAQFAYRSYKDYPLDTVSNLDELIKDYHDALDKNPLAYEDDSWDTRLDSREERWTGRLNQRENKTSTAPEKRKKYHHDTRERSLLMFTHTAPPKVTDNSYHQGKDVTPTAKTQFNYFRTGDNKQGDFLEVNKRKKYVFIKELFDFYKALDTGVNFDTEQTIDNGLLLAEKPTRFTHSGYGSEVNSFAKQKILESKGINYKGDKTPPGAKGAKKYLKPGAPESDIRDYIAAETDPSPKVEQSHLGQVLDHCRTVAEKFTSLRLKNFKLLFKGEKSGFFTYPAVILEPVMSKKPTTKDIEPLMSKIISKFNQGAKIRLFERNSFGFLYPTISDLERAIRIWPGQIDPDYFYSKMSQTLISVDREMSGKQEKVFPSIDESNPNHDMIFLTLDRAILFVRKIYQKGGFAPGEKASFFHNRIVSNLIKARALKQMHDKVDYESIGIEDVFLEVTQVIENLNEYGFQLITLQSWVPSTNDFDKIINESYAPYVSTNGFVLNAATLTHSGMQAGIIAMNIRKHSMFDLGPSYFEFPSKALNRNFRNDPSKGKTGHYDPAYNFTSSEDVRKYNSVPFKDEDHQCVIIDITNIKTSEIPAVLTRHKMAHTIYLYGSLSKHFQLGMDRFTLGILLEAKKQPGSSELKQYYIPEELIKYFITMQEVHNVGLDKEVVDLTEEMGSQ